MEQIAPGITIFGVKIALLAFNIDRLFTVAVQHNADILARTPLDQLSHTVQLWSTWSLASHLVCHTTGRVTAYVYGGQNNSYKTSDFSWIVLRKLLEPKKTLT